MTIIIVHFFQTLFLNVKSFPRKVDISVATTNIIFLACLEKLILPTWDAIREGGKHTKLHSYLLNDPPLCRHIFITYSGALPPLQLNDVGEEFSKTKKALMWRRKQILSSCLATEWKLKSHQPLLSVAMPIDYWVTCLLGKTSRWLGFGMFRHPPWAVTGHQLP